MSSASIAATMLFASLALVALALALMARRGSRPALGIGLAALMTLSGASTWMTRAGQQMPDSRRTQGEIDRLHDENARLLAEVGQIEAQLRDANWEIERLRQGRGAPPPGSPGPGEPPGPASGAGADLNRQIAEQRARIAQQQTRIAEQAKHIADLQRAPDIRARLDRRESTDHYTVHPLEGGHAPNVAGLAGSWYALRLLQRDGRPFVFGTRSFDKVEGGEAVAASARRLEAGILAPVAENARRMRLFVRGGADLRPIAGAGGPPGQPFKVVPRGDGGAYDLASERMFRIERRVTNADLPNLRAQWMRDQLGNALSLLSSADIAILDSAPTEFGERTADILLFVDWR